MTHRSDSTAAGNPTPASQSRFPLLGLVAVMTGVIVPTWTLLALVDGGVEAAAWIPVIILFLFPVNILFFALMTTAVVCGVFAIRVPGASRLLGWVGLILGGGQLLAGIAYVLWSGADILFGG